MYNYAAGMKAAFDQAAEQADTASKTKGKKETPALIKSFEDKAKNHERRVKK
ncbi:MAG: hypothetical protein R3E89_09310 [Thiolinea sp.]